MNESTEGSKERIAAGQQRRQTEYQGKNTGETAFFVRDPDWELSPYTGLNREGWILAGKFLLNGIFRNVPDPRAPLLMPRYEYAISYPNRNTPPHKVQAEYFEGLARSFFIAAPLLKEEPELKIAGISLSEYYRSQLLRACDPEDPAYVLDYAAMEAMGEQQNPFRVYQQTVEVCALVICLWACRELIWQSYSRPEKDRIAAFIRGYAEGNTVPQNWRLFNMLALAFLDREGYPIEEGLMRDHAQAVLNYYAGDGWYRDGQCFDYYSVWAFNVYAPLWNLWYGYRKEAKLSAYFEKHANQMMESLPAFFDRDGYTNMWGRSNIYRNAATSAFAANFFLRNPSADPGLARRISSGSLLQFLSREDVFYQGIPCLGFYRSFPPLIQPYSCAASPFWLGKAFLCLCLPKEHPFWTERETNGGWEKLKKGENREYCLDGPGLCCVNHGSNGMTELRTGKVLKKAGDRSGIWNYGKLSYNTKYPWEAGSDPRIESQQYTLEDLSFSAVSTANACFFAGQRDGVLYRRQFFDFSSEKEYHWLQGINLADFPVEEGLFRADKLRLFQRPLRIRLGAYGFPDNGTEILRKEEGDWQALILKGRDSRGRAKQLAMSIFFGFSRLDYLRQKDCNPDSENSILLYAEADCRKQYGYEDYFCISQVLCRDSPEDFSPEELFPLESIRFFDPEKKGGYGPLLLSFKDEKKKEIDFLGIEGRMML